MAVLAAVAVPVFGLSWTLVLSTAAVATINMIHAINIARRQQHSVHPFTGPMTRRPTGPARVRPIPPPSRTFRGRRAALGAVRRWHDELVKADDTPGERSPRLLILHGKPGVGKTALALKVCQELRKSYPDGSLYANLGQAGEVRAPGEILDAFLLSLGIPESDIPGRVEDRVRQYRSTVAGRRMIILLDAARDASQLRDLLVSAPHSLLVITSRINLPALTQAKRIEVDDLSDIEAVALLNACGVRTGGRDLEYAIEVAESCGHLPIALRAAADLAARHSLDVRDLAERIRDPRTRLTALRGGGRIPAERLSSQYRVLLDRAAEAFRFLSLVQSETFVPWVICPLLQVPYAEAENIVAELKEMNLVDSVGPDPVTGIDRYAFNPFVRLYARWELDRSADERTIEKARKELLQAYLEAIDRVLFRIYRDGYDAERPDMESRYFIVDPPVLRDIAYRPEPWVRAEYRSLVAAMEESYQRGWAGMTWRIARWLGTCVPDRVEVPVVTAAFGRALRAAESSSARTAVIDVLLARGTFFSAIERYPRAFQDLFEAVARTTDAVASDPRLALRRAVAELTIAESLIQAGEYRHAAARLAEARETVAATGEDDLIMRHELLEREVSLDTDGVLEIKLLPHSSDGLAFRLGLSYAQAHRDQNRWMNAATELESATEEFRADARKMATIGYRTTRLHLDWAAHLRGDGSGRTIHSSRKEAVDKARRATLSAVIALRSQIRLSNRMGEVRARYLLARTLLHSGNLDAAVYELAAAEQVFADLDPFATAIGGPLHTRLLRLRGEIASKRNKPEGKEMLGRALAAYHGLMDHRSVRELESELGLTPAERDRIVRDHSGPGGAVELLVDSDDASAATPRVGSGFPVTIRVDPGGLFEDPASLEHFDVSIQLTAEGASVRPAGRSANIGGRGEPVSVSFEVAPERIGSLIMRCQVLSLRDGTLLHDLQCFPMDVLGPNR
ncbi:hypothetical protein MB27_07055 [Actinoplanes utahensis]|uniref:AAA+ ATPase domain-containing protein n=1 Tax=Actinoplanes utahensis TaxID=1869 RepID=A0A0A6UUR7_ACTUT|nr:hypothetical protein MB27_07055 [Actinoplanes utahensis]